jgi:hypothetical protein
MRSSRQGHESREVISDEANKVMRTGNSRSIIVADSRAKPVSSNAWSQVSCHTTKSGSSEYLFPDSASPPYSRLGRKLDMNDCTPLMAMVNDIGAILTNDKNGRTCRTYIVKGFGANLKMECPRARLGSL